MTIDKKQIAQLMEQDIAHFLPHEVPMIFLDKLLDYQADSVICEVTITPSSPYFDSQLSAVPNYVAIEYMAQAVAAHAGFKAKLKQQELKVGFLLGSRKLKLYLPHYIQGNCYKIKVKKLLEEDSGFGVCDCQMYHEEHLVAEAKVNVFQGSQASTLTSATKDTN